jgi:alkylhydroperoxidase family enzyme
MLELEKHVESGGLEPSLLNLVKTKASQLNGCACVLRRTAKDF